MAYKYGKLDPHPEETHPRVKLGDHLTPAQPPTVVDYATRVTGWPMYLNDKLGDCTCAALGHAEEAWSTYATGTLLALPDSDILNLYERVSGYNPATGQNDNGAVEQDVLAEVQKNGIGGHKIRLFAQVDHKNFSEMKQALDMFGSLYLGFQVPQSAEDQFGQGQPWTVVPNSPVIGGHAINLQKWDINYMYPVTWGRLQPMDEAFWLAYGDEAWVIITDDWIEANGQDPLGLNLQQMIAEFDALTGTTQPVQQPSSKSCWLINIWKKLF
jgi:hypothetical protein